MEIPLIIQDGAMLDKIKEMRLDGDTSFQWHPNSIIKADWWNLYLRFLKYLREKEAWFETVRGVGIMLSNQSAI